MIAACNPYRRRRIEEDLFQTVLNDPLALFMYRVYPLPSTMKEYVWVFGSVSESDEATYCTQMCHTFTSEILDKISEREILTKCILSAQEFVRNTLKDTAMVSLRDIARCLKIFVWVYQTMKKDLDSSIIVSIGLVYYFRLNDFQRICPNI